MHENGHEDYDVPRPSNRYSDYDIPLTKEQRDLRTKSGMMPEPPKNRLANNADTSSLSSGSRPMSNASSIFSADASIISSQSGGSSSGKMEPPSLGDDSGRISPSSIDQQLDMISQMVGDAKSSAAAAPPGSSLGLPKYEDSSSHGGSTDNLGVWDDINSEPDSDENEGEYSMQCMCRSSM